MGTPGRAAIPAIFLVSLLAPEPAAAADISASELDRVIDGEYLSLDALYRDLHARPELSFAEHATTALVRERMRALGLAERYGGRVHIVHAVEPLTAGARRMAHLYAAGEVSPEVERRHAESLRESMAERLRRFCGDETCRTNEGEALVAGHSVVEGKPADVILTGTPIKLGPKTETPRWLKPGDVIEISCPELGTLRNEVMAET